MIKIWTCRKFALTLHRKTHGTMAEWLGIGLQNRAQQFDSAWYLTKPRRELHGEAFFICTRRNDDMKRHKYIKGPKRGSSRNVGASIL